MKFSLAAGARPKADAFGLKSAGLNSTSKPKKAFSFSKMIPRQAALFAKTMRGGPPKLLKAEARVGAAAAPASPVVYGPPPPPNFTRSVAEPRATPPKRPAEAEATPPTASKRARGENNPDDVYARRLGLATGRPDISLPPPLDSAALARGATPIDAAALARDKAARRMEAAIARARAAGVAGVDHYDAAWVADSVKKASCPETFADRVESAMAKRVEAQSRSPAGSRPLASPRVTFTERPKPKTPASTTKELKCDKCDGPHATEDCPFFKGDRDDHPDARNRAPHEGLGSDGGRAVLRQARVVRQPGDGSCLFHSLAHGLRDARVADYDHRRLRQALMDWLARHEDLKIADTPVRDWVLWDANQAVPAYVGRMRIGGWGGGIEMAACARKFRVDVHVYERSPAGARHPFKRISRFDAPARPPRGRVDVLYCGGVHYDGLVVPRGAVYELDGGAPTPSPRSPPFSPRHNFSPVGGGYRSFGSPANRYGGGHGYGRKQIGYGFRSPQSRW